MGVLELEKSIRPIHKAEKRGRPQKARKVFLKRKRSVSVSIRSVCCLMFG